MDIHVCQFFCMIRSLVSRAATRQNGRESCFVANGVGKTREMFSKKQGNQAAIRSLDHLERDGQSCMHAATFNEWLGNHLRLLSNSHFPIHSGYVPRCLCCELVSRLTCLESPWLRLTPVSGLCPALSLVVFVMKANRMQTLRPNILTAKECMELRVQQRLTLIAGGS